MSEGEGLEPRSWPAGEPNEAEINAKIAHDLEELTVTITRGDLARLDKMITLFDAMAELFDSGFYDDAWNLRNRMVPFEPGHEHFDSEMGEDDEPPELTKPQIFLLDWLAKEDASALGECKGPDLDRLVELGLAKIIAAPKRSQLDTDPSDWSGVSLTEAGHAAARSKAGEGN